MNMMDFVQAISHPKITKSNFREMITSSDDKDVQAAMDELDKVGGYDNLED